GENFVQLAQASSLCGACKDVCPVDIDLPKLLTRVRAGQSLTIDDRPQAEGAGLSPSTKFGLQMYTRIATHPKLYAASQKFAALMSSLFAPYSLWIRLPAFTGWGYSKDLPRFAAKTFRDGWNKNDVMLPNEHLDDVSKAKDPLHNDKDSHLHDLPGISPAAQVSAAPLPQSDVDKIEQFTNELAALGGNIYRTKDVTKDVIEFLNARRVNKIHLEPNTLDENLITGADIEVTSDPDEKILVGVTKTICGLADTGSVLVTDGEGSPLHASLLAEIHIAVLKASAILTSMPDAMHLVKDKNAVFISGPSRTADIEMTLSVGVHGPKEIHVFVDDSIS
ncbi:MAG TPA: LUD domain-containing protein, partial [Anaerolineales bacterium]|nr:LUD domain-containing protein [Anaerolineales bacterium]